MILLQLSNVKNSCFSRGEGVWAQNNFLRGGGVALKGVEGLLRNYGSVKNFENTALCLNGASPTTGDLIQSFRLTATAFSL